MCGLIESPFENPDHVLRVLRDSTFDLIDAGKLRFASGQLDHPVAAAQRRRVR